MKVMMHAPDPVIKRQIQQRFDRASRMYHKHNQIQAAVLDDLLPWVKADADTLLDLGCGPGVASNQLRQRCRQYVAMDISRAMLEQCPADCLDDYLAEGTADNSTIKIQADMDQLPLATASVDCAFSSLAVQWSHSPKDLLNNLVRISRHQGQVIFSTVLEGSLEPLSSLRQSLDGYPLANTQLTYNDWQMLIEQTAGLRPVRMEKKEYTFFATSLSELLSSIKGVGAGARNSRPALSRSQIGQLEMLYEEARTNEGLPLHYSIGLFVLERL